MGLPLSNWNKSHKAVFIAYLSKWVLLVGQGHWAFSGRSELASVVWLWRWGCCWLVGTQKCVPGPGVPTWLTYSQKPRAVLDWLKNEFIEASFPFYTGIFLRQPFISSWCGSQSNCSLIVRNYWKPVFRKPFTKSILRICKAFWGRRYIMLFCYFCYNIVTTKLCV